MWTVVARRASVVHIRVGGCLSVLYDNVDNIDNKKHGIDKNLNLQSDSSSPTPADSG